MIKKVSHQLILGPHQAHPGSSLALGFFRLGPFQRLFLRWLVEGFQRAPPSRSRHAKKYTVSIMALFLSLSWAWNRPNSGNQEKKTCNNGFQHVYWNSRHCKLWKKMNTQPSPACSVHIWTKRHPQPHQCDRIITNPQNIARLRSLSLSLSFCGRISVPKWQRDGFPVSISMATDSQPPSIPWHDSSSSGSWGRYKSKQESDQIVALNQWYPSPSPFCWIYDDCMIGCMGTMLRCLRSQKNWPPMCMDGELTS